MVCGLALWVKNAAFLAAVIMNRTQLQKIVLIAAGGILVLVPASIWLVSSSRAKDRAAELVTASADLVRCMGGDDVKLEKTDVHVGYERRTVLDFPDMKTAKPCLLALEVVKEKWDTYEPVWFNSVNAKGENGVALGERFLSAHYKFQELPLDKSTDVVYLHHDKYGSVLEAGDTAFELYQAARDMYVRDGASEQDVEKANSTRKREAPKVPDHAPRGRVVLSVPGKVSPSNWSVYPSGGASGDGIKSIKGMVLHALSDDGDSAVAWTDDGIAWTTAKGPGGFAGRKALEFRVIDAPGRQRWFILAHGEKDETETHLGKIVEGTLPAPARMPAPPDEWKRAPGGEREAVVIAGDVVAFPVWRIAEKSNDEKEAEKKERKEWDENFADKDVQALITLSEQRRLAREALGIDDDHKRLDGIAYVSAGSPNVLELWKTGIATAEGSAASGVLELPGYGLGGLVPGAQPLVLVGEGGLPAHHMNTFALPPPGEPVGMLAPAAVAKPIDPGLRGSPWLRCISSDDTYWGTTAIGSFLIGMQSGALQLVQMAAYADEGSHMGCGPNVATVTLPFAKDRIFANLLTMRGGETEGAKIPTTSGTTVDMFNLTASSAATTGAVVVGWVARGYAIYTVNLKTDNDFMAPRYLAEVDTGGSEISGLRFVGMGQRMVGVVAREACAVGSGCVTSFEVLVSDDDARSWTVPN